MIWRAFDQRNVIWPRLNGSPFQFSSARFSVRRARLRFSRSSRAVTSVAAADPYFDVVQPLLEQRCGTCHNDDKRESGFSVK